jgi:hypothetical protein
MIFRGRRGFFDRTAKKYRLEKAGLFPLSGEKEAFSAWEYRTPRLNYGIEGTGLKRKMNRAGKKFKENESR